MTDVTEGFAALSDAAPGYEEAHAYYSGSVGEIFGSRIMQRMLRKQGRPFKVNVIQSVVDALADRLDLLSMTVVGAEETASAQLSLNRIAEENALTFEATNIMHRAAEYGDAYVMVWEGAEEGDAPVVNYHSPLSMRVVYDPDNPRKKRFAVHAWRERSPLGDAASVWRANLLYPDRIERWTTKPGTKPEESDAWVEAPADDDDPDSWRVDNPYDAVPVFHFRNATPYGVPRHFNGYGTQDAINKLIISHMSTIDFHIAPQRYALTEGEEADDDFDIDDDPEFEDADNGDRREQDTSKGIRSGPGEVWWLKNVKSVGQFAAADSDAFTKPIHLYLRLMAQTTKTPLHLVDESGDEPSGESRRRKEGPLTSAVRDYSRLFGAVWEELLAFALKVAGVGDHRVKVAFAPPELVSDAEGWATVKAKIEAGVPVRQALMEAGYTDEQVEEWFPEGEENQLRVVDLQAVADILQKLGAAVSLGIISEEEARALLPEGILPEGAAPPGLVAPAPAAPPVPTEG